MVSFAASCAASSAFAESKAAVPWYERFTFSSEYDTGANSWSPRVQTKANVKVSPRSRWGVTFGMQEQSAQIPGYMRNSSTSAGAFYDFSKNFRIGGGVTVPYNNYNDKDKNANSPGVKVESAFRF